jgi:hypothetical protein
MDDNTNDHNNDNHNAPGQKMKGTTTIKITNNNNCQDNRDCNYNINSDAMPTSKMTKAITTSAATRQQKKDEQRKQQNYNDKVCCT